MDAKKLQGRNLHAVLRHAGFAAMLGAQSMLGHAAAAENPVAVAMPGKPVFPYGAYDLGTQGYAMQEYFVSGTAVSYALAGAAGADGIAPAKAAGQAAYKTRIVVITPTDPAKFNGTVVVEWLNVSGGADVPTDFIMLHRELLRDGYAYAGVSAQKVGIDGGASLQNIPPLKKVDAARYGGLVHPGDAYSYDIFSDAGRLLKSQPQALLGKLRPKHVIAAGESQSAMYLATYVNEVDPLAKVYDGFLIHSRAGFTPSLSNTPMMRTPLPELRKATALVAEPRVPVLQLITETDLVGIGALAGLDAVQQADTPHLRSWELAGAAHLDNYLLAVGGIDTPQLPVAKLAAAWAPLQALGPLRLAEPMNNGPQQHYVVEAALVRLNDWVAAGKAPPTAPRIDLAGVDAKGGLQGGVRTPWVDVPVTHLSGFPVTVLGPSLLGGSSIPYDAAALAQFYPGGKVQYLRAFAAALDRSIRSGFILPADRVEILQLAQLGYPGHAKAASP